MDIEAPPERATSPIGPSTIGLFRAEAIEGLRSRHGRPVPLFGIGSWALVLFMFTVFVAIIVFLFTSNFSRKETVEGFLQPETGSATINFSRAGRVTDIYVREGQSVVKGQRLMKVSLDSTLDSEKGTLGAQLARANEQQNLELATELTASGQSSRAQQAELRSRAAGARAQIAHLNTSVALQRQRLALNQQNLDGLMKLREKGFVSAMRLRDKQAEILAAEQAIADTQRQLDQTRSDVGATEAMAAQADAEATRAAAQLRANQASLDEKRAQSDAESSVVLVAPFTGKLVTVRAVAGEAVQPGVSLATVLPRDARLEAVLWVPSRAIGFVTKQADVRLMFDAFPFERFGSGKGTVTSISSTPVDAREVPLANAEREGALYRVRVKLGSQAVHAYGKAWALAPGSRLRADVILERQSLIDWFLDPLRAFRGRSA